MSRQLTFLAGGAVVAVLALLALASSASAHGGVGLMDAAALETRGPITILSDDAFTAANGVRRGSGTPADPFVIENWTIQGTGTNAILIERVDASFVIHNVLVDVERGGDFENGIFVTNVTGGMIEHVEVHGQGYYGIYVGDVDGLDVCEVEVSSNGFVGVYAHHSFNMTWLGNLAYDNHKHGFYFAFGSSFNRITQSRSFGHFGDSDDSFGIYSGIASNDNVMDNNTLSGNGAGIQVTLVERNVIRDNVLTNNILRGITTLLSQNTTIADNTITDNHLKGITVWQSKNVSIIGNTIQGHEKGIESSQEGGHVVTRNLIRQNGYGIHFELGVRNNVVYDNVLSNDQNARDDVGLTEWNVSKREGPNVVGGRFIGGNYWSDASLDLHDHDEDGLFESHGPYDTGIAPGGDWLPIADVPNGPKASFTVSDDRPRSLELVWFNDTTTPGSFDVVNMTWDFGDGSPKAYGASVAHAFPEAGDYVVTYRVMDELGITSTVTRLVSTQNLLPVPRLAGPDRLYTTGAPVALDASPSFDLDGEVTAYRWTFGDGATGEGARVTHQYAGEGHYAASLLVVDNRGGAASLPILVTVDTVPPATAAAVLGNPGNRGWIQGPATVTLSAVDPGSGVLRSEWRLAGETAWRAYEGGIVLGDGAHDVEYRSVDRAGNEEPTRAIRVRADATPPATRVDASRWFGPAAPIELAPEDAHSGVAVTYYRVPGDSAWRLYEGGIPVAGLPAGDVTLGARSVDVAGNEEAATSVIARVDLTPPHVTVLSPYARSATVDGRHVPAPPAPADVERDLPIAAVVVGRADVRLAAADSESGLGLVRILVDGALLAEARGAPPEATWTVPPGLPGRHVLRVEAYDLVGNVRVLERTVWGVPSELAPPSAPTAPEVPPGVLP